VLVHIPSAAGPGRRPYCWLICSGVILRGAAGSCDIREQTLCLSVTLKCNIRTQDLRLSQRC
jgi:hypothetical protein